MRFLSALRNDIRYQIKYGFYFLYAFISAVYITVLYFIPAGYKGIAASLIILTDPVMLGMFFIGGIWLLEQREGLHGFWSVSPLPPFEYILSKAASLSFISALAAAVIVLAAYSEARNIFLLAISVFAGAAAHTVIGLISASYARSVNQYLLITSAAAGVIVTPAVLTAFGVTHFIFELLPATALWRIIAYAIGIENSPGISAPACLVFWFAAAVPAARGRIESAMAAEGGDTA